MKTNVFKITLIIFTLLTAASFNSYKTEQIVEYELEGQRFELLVADGESEWEKGLMSIRQLKNADGMMFVFPDKKQRVFWNKNTFVDLDVYWILDDEIVGRDFLPSIEESDGFVYVSSPAPVNKVVEIVIN